NSHPFARRDASGRLWTLAHNGTIFESPVLEPYARIQKGSTDSERILYYLVDRINAGGNPGALSAEERFSIVEDVIRSITHKNMVNLLIYDGDLFYVHANRKDSLHMLKREDSVVISTKALSQTGWEPVPLNIPLAFQCGRLVYTGRNHGNEYIKEETDTPQQKLSTEDKARQ
ncbi:MAG: class II glutamine amidotransferase, partial [Firmicutes bacterium]|nr:class II glutamine amidotransferase [Bacillota bacterium]